MNIPNKRKVLQWQWVSVFWEISKPVRFYYSMNSSLCLLNLWNHIDDNLPHVSVSFHVLMSLCNVIQAKCAVNHWPQGGRLVWEIWQHPACKSFHQVSFVLWKENAKYISGPVANIYITRDVWKVTQASCLILANQTQERKATLTWVSAEMTKHSCCVTSVFNSYLQAARAEETSEQVASLGQQFAQQISLYRPPSHGAVQHPPAIDGQRAHIWLPVAPTNGIKDHICSLACEIRDFTITGNCPSPIQSRSWFKIAPNQRC